MKDFTRKFMASSKIVETPQHTVEKIIDFLTEPEQVNKMIIMSEMGFPALSGVVKDREERFAYSDFPLHHDGPGANAQNRRNIGWMIKAIMAEYGYQPKDSAGVQARIGNFSGAKYFTTSARYVKTGEACKRIRCSIEEITN